PRKRLSPLRTDGNIPPRNRNSRGAPTHGTPQRRRPWRLRKPWPTKRGRCAGCSLSLPFKGSRRPVSGPVVVKGAPKVGRVGTGLYGPLRASDVATGERIPLHFGLRPGGTPQKGLQGVSG